MPYPRQVPKLAAHGGGGPEDRRWVRGSVSQKTPNAHDHDPLYPVTSTSTALSPAFARHFREERKPILEIVKSFPGATIFLLS